MKMKKKLMLLIIVLFVCNVYSQSVEEMVDGPLTGYTFFPVARTFMLYTQYSTRSATSFWDIDGNEVSYSSMFGGEVSPKLIWDYIALAGKYSINNKLCFSLFVPIVVNQKLEANPAPGYEYYTDLTGQTGIGDIILGGEYLIAKTHQYRATTGFGFQFASGTSPEDLSETDFSSTGSGHTSLIFNICTDFMINQSLLLSGEMMYVINNKATFTTQGYSWNETEGNELDISGRMTFNVTSNLVLGAKIMYSTTAEDKLDGNLIDDSNGSMLSSTPMFGYQVKTSDYKVNLYSGYRLELAGKNYAKANGFWIGISIFK